MYGSHCEHLTFCITYLHVEDVGFETRCINRNKKAYWFCPSCYRSANRNPRARYICVWISLWWSKASSKKTSSRGLEEVQPQQCSHRGWNLLLSQIDKPTQGVCTVTSHCSVFLVLLAFHTYYWMCFTLKWQLRGNWLLFIQSLVNDAIAWLLPSAYVHETRWSSGNMKHVSVYNAWHNNWDAKLLFLRRWWWRYGRTSQLQ